MNTHSIKYFKKLPNTLNINDKSVILTDTLGNCTINISNSSELIFVSLLKKGWRETKKLHFNLNGKDAKITFLAFIIAKKENTFPFETISNHKVKNTEAYYYVRSAMFDSSEVNYKGSLVIKKNAALTNCYLAHHTLMLSPNAKTNSIPCLEIEADDVKAGHAATIGKIDEESLFYFKSRGIGNNDAERLLLRGFLEKDLNKIDDEALKKLISTEIEKSIK